jgi:3-keto steroid reductase
MGGWTGLDWPQAIWVCLTDAVHQVTWPTYKLSEVGVTTRRQTKLPEEEPLGSLFCANVFGHYMLAHNLIPLLRRSGAPNGPGRIIWTSSLEAAIDHFNIEDIQGMRSRAPYESSKTLTDLLALTADLPSSTPFVNSFLSVDHPDDASTPPPSLGTKEPSDGPAPITYLCHPGICGTSIISLPYVAWFFMLTWFYLARSLGSPWHPISTYRGAISAVWLAMSPQSELDSAEAPYREHGGGRSKWGSAATFFGDEYVANTEIERWGFGGVAGSPILDRDATLRRKRGMKVATPADRLHFEDLGRPCWQQMEELRIRWEKLLDEEERS